jgi:aminoglycoside phosphotransferase (APT) family kinase protein
MLAAHASAAVSGLKLVKTAPHSMEGGLAALGWDSDGAAWLIEWPQTDDAESLQRDRIAGARAIGDGLRSRLPFQVPRVAGTTIVDGRTLSVTSFLPGQPIAGPTPSAALAADIGRTIAALHDIPASTLYDQGRPVHQATESMRQATNIVDRAAQTTLLPKALLRRWEAAYEDHGLWQFESTIIHGSLQPSSFLVDKSGVVAVTDWKTIAVGDPAKDLAWMATPPLQAALEPARTSYFDSRAAADARLIQRARFWAELEVASLLLRGIELRSEEMVDRATDLINELHDRISGDLDQVITEPLTQTPHPLSDDRPTG